MGRVLGMEIEMVMNMDMDMEMGRRVQIGRRKLWVRGSMSC